jgi:hypothetical protein
MADINLKGDGLNVEWIERGKGCGIHGSDADRAREFFKTKSRTLVNKVMTVKDAVARFYP